MTEPCKHEGHLVDAHVTFLDDANRWVVSFKLRCAQCGEAFRFIGLPAGVSFAHPTVSITGTELIVPIEPEGTPMLQSHATFHVPEKVGDLES